MKTSAIHEIIPNNKTHPEYFCFLIKEIIPKTMPIEVMKIPPILKKNHIIIPKITITIEIMLLDIWESESSELMDFYKNFKNLNIKGFVLI